MVKCFIKLLDQYANKNRQQTKSKCCSINIMQGKSNILLNTEPHQKDQDKAAQIHATCIQVHFNHER